MKASDSKATAVPKLLKEWFLREKRSFPWRENCSPYAVWVSEVMLQQTQAAVVIPYFLRWMERFPTLKSLAEASQEEVMKLWEGLGYYSRARSLHQGAKMVLSDFAGVLPEEQENLLKIKGIGSYTAGAIQAFAFKKRAAAVDGNVLRVLSRLFAIRDAIDSASVKNEIERLAERLLPEEKPWVVAEGLIELGATICKKIPLCTSCPISAHCKARAEGIEQELPFKKRKQTTTNLDRVVLLILSQGSVMVRQVPQGQVMAGLYEFPYFEDCIDDPSELLLNWTGSSGRLVRKLPVVSHTFTRYKAILTPYLFTTSNHSAPDGYSWIPLHSLHHFPFSSGHRHLIKFIIDFNC